MKLGLRSGQICVLRTYIYIYNIIALLHKSTSSFIASAHIIDEVRGGVRETGRPSGKDEPCFVNKPEL